MRRLAGLLTLLGVIMIAGAGMLAIDSYMTEERKTAARDEINTQINDGADQYEQRREDGCRRRCGFVASMSHMFAGLRDGLFLSMPFDPETVFPQAQTGWVMSAYNLKTLEKTVRRKIWRTAVVTATENQLLKYFDHVATARNAGAVRFYTQGDSIIAMAVMISSEALRAAKQGEQNRAREVETPFAQIDGLPVREHPQISVDRLRNTTRPVEYRHFSMDLDGQVEIEIIALATDEDVQALLSGFDISPVVKNLPQIPAGYDPGAGMIVPEQPTQPEE